MLEILHQILGGDRCRSAIAKKKAKRNGWFFAEWKTLFRTAPSRRRARSMASDCSNGNESRELDQHVSMSHRAEDPIDEEKKKKFFSVNSILLSNLVEKAREDD